MQPFSFSNRLYISCVGVWKVHSTG
jgi:hypothetical protein